MACPSACRVRRCCACAEGQCGKAETTLGSANLTTKTWCTAFRTAAGWRRSPLRRRWSTLARSQCRSPRSSGLSGKTTHPCLKGQGSLSAQRLAWPSTRTAPAGSLPWPSTALLNGGPYDRLCQGPQAALDRTLKPRANPYLVYVCSPDRGPVLHGGPACDYRVLHSGLRAAIDSQARHSPGLPVHPRLLQHLLSGRDVHPSATAVSYALAGRPVFAAGAGALALLATTLRRKVIAKMDSLRAQIQVSGTNAIQRFRRMHMTAILINLAQLVVIVWSLIAFSMQLPVR